MLKRERLPDSPLAQVGADEASRRAAVSSTRAALVTGLLGIGALLALWINNATARAALTTGRAPNEPSSRC